MTESSTTAVHADPGGRDERRHHRIADRPARALLGGGEALRTCRREH